MSVYRPNGAAAYVYDFQLRSRRFCGPTGATSKREAEAVERQKRAEAAEEIKRREALRRESMTFEVASSRYWTEVGQHHKGSDNTLWSLDWLKRAIGGRTRLTSITDSLVAQLVARRRGEVTKRGTPPTPATVNRSMTEVLRKIIVRADDTWGEPVPRIKWANHLLREPRERVRELRADEEAKLFAAIRPDYVPIIRFALAAGCRISECYQLTWSDIDWGARLIWITGKGGKRATIPLTPSLRQILWPLQGHHPTNVFTYVKARGGVEVRKGDRLPITREGLKSTWRRLKDEIELTDFRFHDHRHTAATRLLRSSGNLAAVKRLLRHEKIETTMRYAHVNDDDLMRLMEAAATQSPVKSPVAAISEEPKGEEDQSRGVG
jgi:integrase